MIEPNPGSAEAIAQGCTCLPALNNHGDGTEFNGQTVFCPDWRCPLHGLAAIKALDEHGDAPAG
jgi:hypothetical protein